MKEDMMMIDAIAKEINRHYRILKEGLLKKELNDNGELFAAYRQYEQSIFPGTTKEEFAAIYSQAVIFGLSSAALFQSKRFKEEKINNILDKIFIGLDDLDSFISYILTSIAAIKIPGGLQTFIIDCKDKIIAMQTGDLKEDDILALVYQFFLKRYEPGIHRKIRYYLTPRPAVSFMVNTIHRLLKEKLNIDDGLADLDSHILDPALGTGNFLAEVLRLAIKENTKKYGAGIATSFIQNYFLNNIRGFEIMLPLYIMALIDLWGVIESVPGSSHVHPFYRSNPPTMETPDLPPVYPPALKALSKVPGNLYLTDTLKKGLDIITGRHKGVEISKAKMPVMVILGNPPYSRHSLNKGEQITQLIRDYKMECRGNV